MSIHMCINITEREREKEKEEEKEKESVCEREGCVHNLGEQI